MYFRSNQRKIISEEFCLIPIKMNLFNEIKKVSGLKG